MAMPHIGFLAGATGRFLPAPPFDLHKLPRRVRDTEGLPESLGRMGSLELRLAVRKKEIRKAQKLRFKVFFAEGEAIADARSSLTRRDICPFDRVCDHLYVVDHEAVNRFGRKRPRTVGVYRLRRQDLARADGGFYSAGEFDIAPLLTRHRDKRFLELGRSCVHPDWRSKRVVELLWRGIWTYVRHHNIDVLIGCASLPGINPAAHAAALTFLAAHAPASGEWRVAPATGRAAPLAEPTTAIPDTAGARNVLPPLIKGYLRCGAIFGEGAVIDRQFGTTDILAIMPVAKIDPRYRAHFTTQ